MFHVEEIDKSNSAADAFFKQGPKAVLTDFRLATYLHLIPFSPYTTPYLKQPNKSYCYLFFNLLYTHTITHALPLSFRRACNLPLAFATYIV